MARQVGSGFSRVCYPVFLQTRRGKAGLGGAGQGAAWQDKWVADSQESVIQCSYKRGETGQGRAGRGAARRGWAGLGRARQVGSGFARVCYPVFLQTRLSATRLVTAALGEVMQGIFNKDVNYENCNRKTQICIPLFSE